MLKQQENVVLERKLPVHPRRNVAEKLEFVDLTKTSEKTLEQF